MQPHKILLPETKNKGRKKKLLFLCVCLFFSLSFFFFFFVVDCFDYYDRLTTALITESPVHSVSPPAWRERLGFQLERTRGTLLQGRQRFECETSWDVAGRGCPFTGKTHRLGREGGNHRTETVANWNWVMFERKKFDGCIRGTEWYVNEAYHFVVGVLGAELSDVWTINLCILMVCERRIRDGRIRGRSG